MAGSAVRALSGCHIKSRPGVRQQILYPPRPPDPSRSAVPVGSRAAGRSPRVGRICTNLRKINTPTRASRNEPRETRHSTPHAAVHSHIHAPSDHLAHPTRYMSCTKIHKHTRSPHGMGHGATTRRPYRPSGEGCWHQIPRVQRQGGAFRGAARDPRSGGARRARVSQPKALLSQRYRR